MRFIVIVLLLSVAFASVAVISCQSEGSSGSSGQQPIIGIPPIQPPSVNSPPIIGGRKRRNVN